LAFLSDTQDASKYGRLGYSVRPLASRMQKIAFSAKKFASSSLFLENNELQNSNEKTVF
jgi:hypothetical protein